jgi:hypothetical protein
MAADPRSLQTTSVPLWRAVRNLPSLHPARPFIVCRDNLAEFNECEVYRLDEDGPAARFATEVEAETVALLLNEMQPTCFLPDDPAASWPPFLGAVASMMIVAVSWVPLLLAAVLPVSPWLAPCMVIFGSGGSLFFLRRLALAERRKFGHVR